MGDAGDGAADAAKSDDPEGASCELALRGDLEGEVLAALPFSCAYGVMLLGDVAQVVEDEGEDELRDGLGAVVRDVGDVDVACLGGGDVDDVVARGEDGDEAEPGELGEGFGAEGALVGEEDVSGGGALEEQLGWGAGIDRELAKGFEGSPGEIARVEALAIEYGDGGW